MKRPRIVNPRKRYKVMALTFPFDGPKRYWADCVRKENAIPARFGRDGYYFDRQTRETWLEIGGKAWLYRDAESFRYDLAHNDGNNRMHPDAFAACRVLAGHRLLGGGALAAFLVESQMRSLDWISRSSGLAGHRCFKRIRAARAERGERE